MSLKFVPVKENITIDFYSSDAATFNSYKYICGKQEQEKEKYKTFLYNGDGLYNRILPEEFDITDFKDSAYIKNTCKCQDWDIVALSNPLPIRCNAIGDTYLVLILNDEKDDNNLINWFKTVKEVIWK